MQINITQFVSFSALSSNNFCSFGPESLLNSSTYWKYNVYLFLQISSGFIIENKIYKMILFMAES